MVILISVYLLLPKMVSESYGMGKVFFMAKSIELIQYYLQFCFLICSDTVLPFLDFSLTLSGYEIKSRQ